MEDDELDNVAFDDLEAMVPRVPRAPPRAPLWIMSRREYLRSPAQLGHIDPRTWSQMLGGTPRTPPLVVYDSIERLPDDDDVATGSHVAHYLSNEIQGNYCLDMMMNGAPRKPAKYASQHAIDKMISAVMPEWNKRKLYRWPIITLVSIARSIIAWWKTHSRHYTCPELVLMYFLRELGMVCDSETTRIIVAPKSDNYDRYNAAYRVARKAILAGKPVLVNVRQDLIPSEGDRGSDGKWVAGEPVVRARTCKTLFELYKFMQEVSFHYTKVISVELYGNKVSPLQMVKFHYTAFLDLEIEYKIVDEIPIEVNGIITLPDAIIKNSTEPVDDDFAMYGCFVAGVLHQLAKRDAAGARVMMPELVGTKEEKKIIVRARKRACGVLDTKFKFNEHWSDEERAKYRGWISRDILIDLDHPNYTLEQIEEVARKFAISIEIRDNECNGWKQFDYAPIKPNAEKAVRVRFFYYNGHLYNIRRGITVTPYPRVYTHIKPVSKYSRLPTATYHVDESTWLAAAHSANTEYFVAYVRDPAKHLSVLTSICDAGSIVINSKHGKICNEIKGVWDGCTVILRVAWSYYEGITELFPAWCPSIASMAMYDFRDFIKTELACVQNKLTYNFFKNMCRPLIEMGPFNSCTMGGHIITIDMVRAYSNRCSDLHVYRTEPRWYPYDASKEPHAFYYGVRGSEVVTCSYDVYRRTTDVTWQWMMASEGKSNAVHDWARSINARFNKRINGTQIDKTMINTLIGSLHPAYGEVSQNAVFTEADLSMFLLSSTDKEILRIDPIGDQYSVEYMYRTEAHCYSKQAVYIPAQIIERCKTEIHDIVTWAKSMGGVITGIMTDCVMFWVPEMIDLTPYQNERYHVEVYDRGVFINPGTYCLQRGQEPDMMKRGSLRQARSIEDYFDAYDVAVTQERKPKVGQLSVEDYSGGFACESLAAEYTVIQADAGVGKSRHILENYNERCLLLAPTGVAACGLKTQTMHSLFGLDVDGACSTVDSVARIKKNYQMIADSRTVVVDEAYYCTEDVMRRADMVLRMVSGSNAPFGGKSVVMVGDRWQLTLGDRCAVDYLRDQVDDIVEIELPHHSRMRCNLQYLADVKVLQTEQRLPMEVYESIRARCSQTKHDATWLTFTNADKDKINGTTIANGDPIMLLDNIDIAAGFFNGTRGKLEIKNDVHYIVANDRHRKIKPDQYTKCLAMTIHKSQGCTLDRVNILLDINNRNPNRLLYVALTRVHDYKNVYLEFKK